MNAIERILLNRAYKTKKIGHNVGLYLAKHSKDGVNVISPRSIPITSLYLGDVEKI